MERDLKLIRQKIREAKKLPASNPQEYNFRLDILRHWEFERDKLKLQIKDDKRLLEYLASQCGTDMGLISP